MKTIMILGDTGLVGRHLVTEFGNDFEIVGLSRSQDLYDYKHIAFDLEKESILPVLERHQPDYFISCTRGSFEHQLMCHQEIVNYGKVHQMMLYYYSTVNVFDADSSEIKVESSTLNAKSEYGIFKVSCEEIIESFDKGHIIRLPMVLAKDSPRMDQIRNAHLEKVTVYDVLYLSLILTTQIAILQREVIEKELSGIFHFATVDIIKQRDLYESLVKNKEHLDIQSLEEYYFAIVPTRKDIDAIFYIKDIMSELMDD
ncbi:MAG: sugar nucleotide-binding protein [Clostridiales bacterium]|nr:sugar nucleotide-binding protein [Clostridiales bacterium]